MWQSFFLRLLAVNYRLTVIRLFSLETVRMNWFFLPFIIETRNDSWSFDTVLSKTSHTLALIFRLIFLFVDLF